LVGDQGNEGLASRIFYVDVLKSGLLDEIFQGSDSVSKGLDTFALTGTNWSSLGQQGSKHDSG
jgi:hypothetical protein